MGAFLWRILGMTFVALGVLGAALPLLPTTPFLLAAAYAFARSSPQLHDWLIEHPRFGPLIEDWRRHGAIATETKVLSILTMIAAWTLSFALEVSPTILAIQAVVLTASGLFILTRPSAPPSA